MDMRERLNHFIETKGLKKNFIAKNAEIDEKRLYRILGGRAPLLADELEVICKKGLGVSPAIFFEDHFFESKNVASNSA